MPEYISKEAKQLAQMKFKEKEPSKIRHTPTPIKWGQYWSSIDRSDLQLMLENNDFQYIATDEDSIVVYFSRLETSEECFDRIAKQQAKWDAYELRKKSILCRHSKTNCRSGRS